MDEREKEDLQLKCIRNLPITIDNIVIKAKTLDEIIDIGYSIYNKLLSVFCFNEDEIQKENNDGNLTVYKHLINLCKQDDYFQYISTAFKYFIGINLSIYKGEVMYFVVDKSPIIIQKETFDKIVYAIKMQNSLIQDEETEEFGNPANDKVKELLEKRKKIREKLKKAKQQSNEDGESLTLLELISVVSCNCQGLNIFNVGNLNLYQFNDQFNRMVLLDNHRINIRALMAGAKQEELNMENWMKKIH